MVGGADSAPSARRLGYRLFGSLYDYVLHFRPAEWPVMAAHTGLGYIVAVGFDGMARGAALPAGVLGLVLWVALLNGGTLALNSAFDRDEGDIAYLRRPPPPPRHLAAVGAGAMFAGLALSFALPPAYRIAYAVCLVLSMLYSVPPVRLKARAGADWLINMVGFGTLTPYAGWATTGRRLDGAHATLLLAFCPLFAALYPLTQLYQVEEDARRGDRTLAVRLGIGASLSLSVIAAALAFGLFALAASAEDWSAGSAVRWTALGIAAASWAAVLIPWRLAARRLLPAQHQRRMYWALGAWAVTDVVVIACWAS